MKLAPPAATAVICSITLHYVETKYNFVHKNNILYLSKKFPQKLFFFCNWKIWKYLYSFRIVAIFYFINWIVAAETIEGKNYWREETICGNTVIQKKVQPIVSDL